MSTAWSTAPALSWICQPPSSFLVSFWPSRSTTGGPATKSADLSFTITERCAAARCAAPSPATEPRPSATRGTVPMLLTTHSQPGDAGHVGAPGGLDGLHRPAAARALDDADQRQAQLVGHLLALVVLALDGGVGGAAPHREVVAAHDHRPAVEPRPAEDEVGRRQLLQVVLGVVGGLPGDLADLVEALRVDEPVDALADRVAPAVVLPLDPLRAAQALGELLAALQLVHLGLPVHGETSAGMVAGSARDA